MVGYVGNMSYLIILLMIVNTHQYINQLMYLLQNNKIQFTANMKTSHFVMGVPSSGSLLEQRNISPTH
jgi:hypothetical protein